MFNVITSQFVQTEKLRNDVLRLGFGCFFGYARLQCRFGCQSWWVHGIVLAHFKFDGTGVFFVKIYFVKLSRFPSHPRCTFGVGVFGCTCLRVLSIPHV